MESMALHSIEQNKNNRKSIGDELDTALVGCRIYLVVFPLWRADLKDGIRLGYSNLKENSELISGIFILVYFIAWVVLSYTGPWNLVFGVLVLANALSKIRMFLRANDPNSIWAIIKNWWTNLLIVLLLTVLFLHNGGLIYCE